MKNIIKKFLTTIITLFLVSLFVFAAFDLIPGDPATAMLGTNATPEKLNALREELHLNDPFIIRYASWVSDFVFGDMGRSYSYSMSVNRILSDKLPITLTLTFLSFVFIIIISIPVGIYISEHDGSIISKITEVLNQIFMSVPPFFFGILITLLFGFAFRLFTPGGYVSYTRSVSGFLGYLIFPALAIALPKSAMTIRMLKTSVLSEAKLDYVRTAYSRGNSTRSVLYKHVLKNAFIPVITFLGMTLSDIVAGSLIVEQVFSIPGLGRLLVTSISNRDYPVVQAIIVFIAFLVIVINLIVDIVYRIIDPRMRAE